MPLLQILSAQKRMVYEQPPIFTAKERKDFFRVPVSLKNSVYAFPSLSNRVGFRLMFGYFLATKRFYPPESFHEKDIEYLCKQYNMLPFAFDALAYKGSTYTRHRHVILEHFAFEAFQSKVHNQLINQVIREQIYSWESPQHIFTYILEWLEWQRIELPTYYNLQLIITKANRLRDKKVKQQFAKLLKEEHQVALDQLLEKQNDKGRIEYLFKRLQQLSPSDTPTQIKNNIGKLEIIQSIFEIIRPVLDKLPLNDNAIQHFGEFVKNADSSQIIRKEAIDRYFHLALFCAYQRHVFEDWMARTFISVCKVALNKASAREKERLFEQRKQRKKAFQDLMGIAEDSTELLQKVRLITWLEISAHQKEQQLQQLLPKQPNTPNEDLEQIKTDQDLEESDSFYQYLAEESQKLQQRATPIIKKLTFHSDTPNKPLLKAIQYFRDKQSVIVKTAPTDFLNDEDKAVLVDKEGKFKVSLYKILFFQQVADVIDRGGLRLKYSYNYKDIEDFLIPKKLWDKDPDSFLNKANLAHLKDVGCKFDDYKKMLHHHYQNTNDNILNGKNIHLRKSKNNRYHVVTPKVEKEESIMALFPTEAAIPLSEVLATVDTATQFSQHFKHLQPLYRKKRPDQSLFYAGVTAFGCNLGIPAMAKSVSQIRSTQLENTTNWFFSLENINNANDTISNFIHQLPLANLYRKEQEELRTSSDGQKIKLISNDTIFGNYSAKYYRKGRGIVSYSFVDERYIPFYSLIIDASVREATFVLDGLLHNDAIKSTIHTTDTHGYTEALFGLMDLLGFGFSPNIAKMLRQKIYTFKEHTIPFYKQKGYPILPKGYIKEDLIEDNWMEVLRLLASLKLKYCTASQIFSRLNSYSKQHPLYAAIKEYGRMVKTLHILRYTDDVKMRQESRKSGNAIEASNRFSNAIAFANGGEMIFLTRTEQQIANACKNLIKNVIICWNYMYLTRQVQQTKTEERKQELIQNIKLKTANAWRHIFFTGTYDFSVENSADSFNLLNSQNFELNLN
jgi:TnpA family transposase